MWYLNKEIIKTPKALTVSGVSYPKSIFRDSDLLSSLGLKPFRVEKVNQKYYWIGETSIAEVDGVMVQTEQGTERSVDILKSRMISSVKSTVSSLLSRDDWMVIREMEGGTEMSSELKSYRSSLRSESNAKEEEINSLSTISEVISYENKSFTEVRKIKHTSEESVETYGPETESFSREIDMTMYFESVDPYGEIDPAFVSLTAN